MKFFYSKLILLLIIVIFNLTFISSKKNQVSLKSTSRLKKTQKKDFPTSLGQLKQQLFPQNLMDQDKSIIEESPNDYSLMSPLDQNQTDRLFPQQIYSKDPNEFGLTPANLSDIRPHQVYLVKNLTFLNTVPGFEDPNDIYRPKEKLPPVYHKDQAPYYNPVGTIKNMYKKRKEGLYSVPIEMFGNGTRLYEENKERTEGKNRLIRDQKAYYDPYYVPFVEFLDPLNKTLIKAARDKLSPPAVEYDEYLKRKQLEKNDIDVLLGKKEEIPRTFGKDEGLEQALKKAKTHREAQYVAEEVKTNFEPNKVTKDPYYDSSAEKRFKQIKSKIEVKNKRKGKKNYKKKSQAEN